MLDPATRTPRVFVNQLRQTAVGSIAYQPPAQPNLTSVLLTAVHPIAAVQVPEKGYYKLTSGFDTRARFQVAGAS